MIAIDRFLRLKPDGFASVAKDESGELFLIFKRFNPETGAELEPERQHITVVDLQARRGQLQPEIDAIDAILREIEGLE